MVFRAFFFSLSRFRRYYNNFLCVCPADKVHFVLYIYIFYKNFIHFYHIINPFDPDDRDGASCQTSEHFVPLLSITHSSNRLEKMIKPSVPFDNRPWCCRRASTADILQMACRK